MIKLKYSFNSSKNINKENEHNCMKMYNCNISKVIPNIIDNQIDTEVYTQGGKKKQIENKYNPIIKNDPINLKIISDNIIRLILDTYPFILNDERSQEKILDILHGYLKRETMEIHQQEYDILLKMIKDNLFSNIKRNIMSNHPLLKTVNDNNFINNKVFVFQNKNLSHRKRVCLSKNISANWNAFEELPNFNIPSYCPDELIDPLFMLIYANKYPGIEDLSILQDYYNMMEDLSNNTIGNDNIFLLTLRLSDTNILPTRNLNHNNYENNEQHRASISILLRQIADTLRTGGLTSSSSRLLLDILKDVRMPTAKFEEENLIQAILATFSFKPTLITHPGFYNFSNVDREIPEAVYTINYPINDFYHLQNTKTPMFSNDNFNFLKYDNKSQTIVFSFMDKNSNVNNPENLIQDFYKFISNKSALTYDVNSFSSVLLKPNSGISNSMTNYTVRISNGIFIISVYREQASGLNCHPLFFGQSFNKTLNMSPIVFDRKIDLNNSEYFLTGALCIDTVQNDAIYENALNILDSDCKISTFSVFYSGNYWFKYYDPYLRYNNIEEFINTAIQNYAMTQNVSPDDFEQWINDNADTGKEIYKNIINRKLSMSNFIIDEITALNLISTNAVLVFYNEPYDIYRNKIRNGC